MLTNDQCFQVAKLWGWRRIGDSHKWEQRCPKGGISWEPISTDNYPVGISIGCGPYMTTKFLRESAIPSWTGFGQTVEAMAERKVYFIGNGFYWWNDFGHQSVSIEWKSEKPLEIIEATHLAALEANEEKK